MLMGVCVAAAWVSCSNELVDDGLRPAGGNDSGGISFVVADDYTRGGSFGNRPGSSTRATVTTTDNIEQKSFTVYGDMTALDSSKSILIFNGEEVSHNGSQWTYSNIRYWFSNYEYSFTAAHPKLEDKAAIQNLKYTDNSLSFTYSPSTYSDGIDIMTATHRRNSNVAITPVNFEFHHILSRINFKAEVDNTAVNDIVITHLALVNVPTKAAYSIKAASTGSNTNDYTEEWSDFLDKDANCTLFEMTDEITIPKGTTKEFFPVENALMIIPQEVPEDVELQITYTTKGSGKSTTASTPLRNLTITAHNGVWEMGKAYTYSFTLGDNESIIFNVPTVQNWNEAEGGNYVITD